MNQLPPTAGKSWISYVLLQTRSVCSVFVFTLAWTSAPEIKPSEMHFRTVKSCWYQGAVWIDPASTELNETSLEILQCPGQDSVSDLTCAVWRSKRGGLSALNPVSSTRTTAEAVCSCLLHTCVQLWGSVASHQELYEVKQWFWIPSAEPFIPQAVGRKAGGTHTLH